MSGWAAAVDDLDRALAAESSPRGADRHGGDAS